MRKWNVALLALALACLPAAGFAEELPDLFAAVYEGVGEGLAQAAETIANEQEELTLTLEAAGGRIEEGKTMTVTIAAGNPMPREAAVSFALIAPERIAAAPDTAWEAVLPAASVDPETGETKPSVTAFTRELALIPGGGSEEAALCVEMSMGTRFYRAQQVVQLCVPDVTVETKLEGAQEGRVSPGDLAVYQIDVKNSGTAAKEIELALTLPEDTAAEQIPAGFAFAGRVLRGTVCAEAASGEDAFIHTIRVPVRIAENALDGDADASRLMAGVLTADGERVALPRMQVCGPKVSARMIADKTELKAGEEATLRVVLVNSGLAAADVRVNCVLPQGLALAGEEQENKPAKEPDKKPDKKSDRESEEEPEATAGEAVLSKKDGGMLLASAPAARAAELAFDVHMEAAEQSAGGVTAFTKVIDLPVTALAPQEQLQEELMGAALTWQVEDEPPQLAQALAMRVSRPAFMGIDRDDWNGVFWAALLLVITVGCLCAAVRSDKREEDFCCE